MVPVLIQVIVLVLLAPLLVFLASALLWFRANPGPLPLSPIPQYRAWIGTQPSMDFPSAIASSAGGYALTSTFYPGAQWLVDDPRTVIAYRRP